MGTKRTRYVAAIAVLLVSLGLLGAAGWLAFGQGKEGPRGHQTPAAYRPTPVYAPSATPALAGLRVGCNAPCRVWLEALGSGEVLRTGRCLPEETVQWAEIPPGSYRLHAYSHGLAEEVSRVVALFHGEETVALSFPGVLLVEPEPEGAEVEVNGRVYRGAVRLRIPGEACPHRVAIKVRAPGYQEYGRETVVKAGEVSRHPIALVPLPTAVPALVTRVPTVVRATAVPTPLPFTVEERVELVRQKLYESVNCDRTRGGLPPVPYLWEWQDLADGYARAWRDHFRQYGVDGFEDTPWRQQFWAAGGDAVPDGAAFDLYVPDYYIYAAPASRWETFNMCDPGCPQYSVFAAHRFDQKPIRGVVIGMAPWWDGDILNAAVVVGWKW